MSILFSGMAAMSTFHPEANPALEGMHLYSHNPIDTNKQILRILGKAPTLAACAYRHRIGR
jgi:citrate synthase